MSTSQINWPGLMRAGICGLKLTPATFWALTPFELELMLGKPTGLMPMGRTGLDALLAAYPDTDGEPE